MMNEWPNDNDSRDSATSENSKLARTCFMSPASPSLDNQSDIKAVDSWNYSNFVKILSDQRKINWSQVLRHIDNPEIYIGSKKSFAELIAVCDIIKEVHKISFPRELFVGKWEYIRVQVNFIERLLEQGKDDISIYKEVKNKNYTEYDSNPPVRNTPGFINSNSQIFLWKDFVTRMVELSDSNQYATIKSLFE